MRRGKGCIDGGGILGRVIVFSRSRVDNKQVLHEKYLRGSQFFIMHEDGEFLDGQYAAFGKVLEGMDVVDAIAGVDTDSNDRPRTEQKIKSITIDTKGQSFPEPEKLSDPYHR